MAPLTPFLTETMFQNLRRSLPQGSPMSIHFLDIPSSVPAQPGDEQIEASVSRMQTVIELGRVIRERRNLPLRTPLRCLTVAHEDPAFIADLTGVLSTAAAFALQVDLLCRAVLYIYMKQARIFTPMCRQPSRLCQGRAQCLRP